MKSLTKSIYPFIALSFVMHVGLVSMSYLAKPSGLSTSHLNLGLGNSLNITSSILNETKPQIKTPSRTKPAPKTSSTSELAPTSASESSTASLSGTNEPKNKYMSEVYQILNDEKKYPKRAKMLRQEGKVIVELKLSASGELLGVKILQSSPYKLLNDATLDAIKNIRRFPVIPIELNLNEMTFRVPFDYKFMDE